MLEPVTPTAVESTTLAFTKSLESGAGELFTEVAITQIEQLRQKILEKFRGKPLAEYSLVAVERGSQFELGRLAVYLQGEMDDDPQFAKEVRDLAQEINLWQGEKDNVATDVTFAQQPQGAEDPPFSTDAAGLLMVGEIPPWDC